MTHLVLLDSGPLGMASNPNPTDENARCTFWVRSLPTRGMVAGIPEIADYEVRRELLRAGKTTDVRRLDAVKAASRFLPITSEIMLLAAELWAQARRRGVPTADDRALDADVILAAQARILSREENTVVVATTNIKHLSRFVDARLWPEIE